jgi:hypothetical protein
MTGSGLIDFLINIIVLFAAGAIFFISIDKIAPDEFFAKIAKIAIGALMLVALIVVVASVFGMGGGLKVSAQGVLWFAVAVIVAVVVLYVLNMAVDWIATNMGFPQLAAAIKYVLGAIVLIALLIAAANFLFGFKIGNFRVGEIREGDRPGTGYVTASAGYLPGVLAARSVEGQLEYRRYTREKGWH